MNGGTGSGTTTAAGVATVRDCLAAIKPGIDIDTIADDTPLLEERLITSFDILDLLLHLEQASGRRIAAEQLEPGCFRDIETIARVFLCVKAGA